MQDSCTLSCLVSWEGSTWVSWDVWQFMASSIVCAASTVYVLEAVMFVVPSILMVDAHGNSLGHFVASVNCFQGPCCSCIICPSIHPPKYQSIYLCFVSQQKFSINCVSSPAINELMRGIRGQLTNLITGIPEKEMSAMALGLAHR